MEEKVVQIRRRWREHVQVCRALIEVLAEQELITRMSRGAGGWKLIWGAEATVRVEAQNFD